MKIPEFQSYKGTQVFEDLDYESENNANVISIAAEKLDEATVDSFVEDYEETFKDSGQDLEDDMMKLQKYYDSKRVTIYMESQYGDANFETNDPEVVEQIGRKLLEIAKWMRAKEYKPEWHKYPDEVPDKSCQCLVTVVGGEGDYVTLDRFSTEKGSWMWNEKVKAWMEKPQAFEE